MISAPEEVVPGIWRVFFDMPWHFLKSVNAYLIQDADGYTLFDCGLDHDDLWASLLAQLEALGVPLKAIHTFVASHGHPDHTGLVARLLDQTELAILMHGSEQAFIDYRRQDESLPQTQRWLRRFGVPEDEVDTLAGQVKKGDRDTPGLPVSRVLRGGEELRFGRYTFEAHWTPGHTPGHVCLYDPGTQVLLCGDHILEGAAPNVSLLPYTDENPMPGYIESLAWLSELPVQAALPGHGERMADLHGRAKALVKHQLDRREQVQSLLTSRPQTAYELAAQIWAETVPNNWSQFNPRIRRNAIGTLAAHLELLANEGRIGRVEDDAGVTGYTAR